MNSIFISVDDNRSWWGKPDLIFYVFTAGPDSPTSPVKDLTTHTRALKLKHQSLEERLELCLLELRKLCIREAVSNYYTKTCAHCRGYNCILCVRGHTLSLFFVIDTRILNSQELTGKLPSDYPLMPEEKLPRVRRRIGACFKLDEGLIHLDKQVQATISVY